MKQLFWVFAILLSFSLLAGSCVGNRYGIRPIVVEITSRGYLFAPHDFYRAYYQGNLRMYESHYFEDSTFSQFDSTDNHFKRTRGERHARTRFFVFHKDSAFGYNFDQHYAERLPTRMPVDSMLQAITLQGDKLADKLAVKPDSIIWNSNRTALRVVYLTPQTLNTPAYKTQYSFRSDLNHIPYSFSPALDSAWKMKLYKVEGSMSEFYDSLNNKRWPEMYIKNEMKKVNVPDSVDLRVYLNKCKSITKFKYTALE